MSRGDASGVRGAGGREVEGMVDSEASGRARKRCASGPASAAMAGRDPGAGPRRGGEVGLGGGAASSSVAWNGAHAGHGSALTWWARTWRYEVDENGTTENRSSDEERTASAPESASALRRARQRRARAALQARHDAAVRRAEVLERELSYGEAAAQRALALGGVIEELRDTLQRHDARHGERYGPALEDGSDQGVPLTLKSVVEVLGVIKHQFRQLKEHTEQSLFDVSVKNEAVRAQLAAMACSTAAAKDELDARLSTWSGRLDGIEGQLGEHEDRIGKLYEGHGTEDAIDGRCTALDELSARAPVSCNDILNEIGKQLSDGTVEIERRLAGLATRVDVAVGEVRGKLGALSTRIDGQECRIGNTVEAAASARTEQKEAVEKLNVLLARHGDLCGMFESEQRKQKAQCEDMLKRLEALGTSSKEGLEKARRAVGELSERMCEVETSIFSSDDEQSLGPAGRRGGGGTTVRRAA